MWVGISIIRADGLEEGWEIKGGGRGRGGEVSGSSLCLCNRFPQLGRNVLQWLSLNTWTHILAWCNVRDDQWNKTLCMVSVHLLSNGLHFSYCPTSPFLNSHFSLFPRTVTFIVFLPQRINKLTVHYTLIIINNKSSSCRQSLAKVTTIRMPAL